MAGIEKVCELSGDYPGHLMYDMKRNHIQVVPKYRKLFRGHKATLYIFKDELKVCDSYGRWKANMNCINSQPTEEDWDSHNADRVVRYENGVKQVYSVFYNNLAEYKAELRKRGQRLVQEFEYVLDVPSLPGQVDGLYINYTTDISTVIRRLSRLVGHRNITIKYKDGECSDFVEALYISRGGECV